MHNDAIPAVARNVGIQTAAQGLIAKTYFNQVTQLSKDLYQLYKGGDMFAFSVGFIPLEWDDVDAPAGGTDAGGVAPLAQRVYTKWELLEYSLVNIPMNPDAVTLSAEPRSMLECIVRRAVQKGVISPESESLRFLGLATDIALIAPKENATPNAAVNKEEKSGRELSRANARELAAHIRSIQSGVDGVKQFLAEKGYDADDLSVSGESDEVEPGAAAVVAFAGESGQRPDPTKSAEGAPQPTLEEFYGG